MTGLSLGSMTASYWHYPTWIAHGVCWTSWPFLVSTPTALVMMLAKYADYKHKRSNIARIYLLNSKTIVRIIVATGK